jgi:hypothetical protein
VIDVHRRDLAVPRLGRGDALADLLEDGRSAAHVALAADGIAQLGAHPLEALMNFAFELLDEGLVDGRGHE